MIVYLTFFGYPLNLLHPLHYQFGLSEGGHVHPWSRKCKTMGSFRVGFYLHLQLPFVLKTIHFILVRLA